MPSVRERDQCISGIPPKRSALGSEAATACSPSIAGLSGTSGVRPPRPAPRPPGERAMRSGVSRSVRPRLPRPPRRAELRSTEPRSTDTARSRRKRSRSPPSSSGGESIRSASRGRRGRASGRPTFGFFATRTALERGWRRSRARTPSRGASPCTCRRRTLSSAPPTSSATPCVGSARPARRWQPRSRPTSLRRRRRLRNLQASRERLHGHNYRVSVRWADTRGRQVRAGGRVAGLELSATFDAPQVDLEASGIGEDGYVVDFGEVKKAVRALCRELDERFLCPMKSPHLEVRPLTSSADSVSSSPFPVAAPQAPILVPLQPSLLFSPVCV